MSNNKSKKTKPHQLCKKKVNREMIYQLLTKYRTYLFSGIKRLFKGQG